MSDKLQDALQRAMRAAGEAIYFADSSDYYHGLHSVLQALWPAFIDELEEGREGLLLFNDGETDNTAVKAAILNLMREDT